MYLERLKELWDGVLNGVNRFRPESKTKKELAAAETLIQSVFEYHRVGHDQRPMSFRPDGLVGQGAADCECIWDVREDALGMVLDISSHDHLTCSLKQDVNGTWQGEWLRFEKMPVLLSPTAELALTAQGERS